MRLGLSAGFPVMPSLAAPLPAGLLSGAQGFAFDPSDFASMSVARDGSGPAPGIGDVVGMLMDRSGNGFHAVAPSDAARPRLELVGSKPALTFDGVDDVLVLSDVPIGPLFSIFFGFVQNRRGTVLGNAVSGSPPYGRLVRAAGGKVRSFAAYPDGSLLEASADKGPAEVEGTLMADGASLSLTLRGGAAVSSPAAGPLASVVQDLHIGDNGAPGSDPGGFSLFGLAAFTAAAVDDAKRAEAEAWISARMGALA